MENQISEKRRRLGFLMIGIGAFLCVFGFLITMILINEGVNFNLALYGATGLGGVLLLAGLISVMG